MFRGTLALFAVLTVLALAACGHPNYPPGSDGMIEHHVSYIGI